MSAQFLYWLVTHPEAAKTLDAKKWKSHLFKWQKGDVFLPDLRPKAGQVELIRELGVLSLLEDSEYNKHSEKVQAILERAKNQRWRVKRVFDLTVTEQTDPISFIGKLLVKLGMNHAKVRGDGETRWYQVIGLNEVNRCAVLQAWNQKYADLIAPEGLTAGVSCLITREEVSENFEERELTAGDDLLVTRGQVSAIASNAEDIQDGLNPPNGADPIQIAAKAIEACRSFKEFATTCQRQISGKSGEFWRSVITVLRVCQLVCVKGQIRAEIALRT